MEQTGLSGPLGRSAWAADQPFPLGFHTLDADDGGGLCQNSGGPTGFHFQDVDRENTLRQIEEDEPLNLDGLTNGSDYSGGDVLLEQDVSSCPQSPRHGNDPEELTNVDQSDGYDDISDSALTWLFSLNLTDKGGENSAPDPLSLTEDAPLEDTSLRGQEDLISDRNSETETGTSIFLVDLSHEQPPSCVLLESSDPQGVSEEQVDDDAGLPPSQGGESLSPETGDKGLFLDPVTDLSVGSNTTLPGLPERNHLSTSPERSEEGSVPLLDSDVPDCANCLSLCPASPVPLPSVDFPTKEPEWDHEGAPDVNTLTAERLGEDDSLTAGLSAESSSVTVPLPEDAFFQGDVPTATCSADNESQDLMEGRICSEAEHQRNEEMALDLGFPTDEVHDRETLDLTPSEGVHNQSSPHPQTGQRDEEASTDANRPEEPDGLKAAPFEFPVQESGSCSPEPGWTSVHTEESLPLSEMAADDSLPVVSTSTSQQEDVSPLKTVFDALDQDGDGFVRIEEFMEFAAAYGADQVKDLTKFLDPSGLGVISFEDFHRGISAISNGGPDLQLYGVHYSPGDGAVGCTEEYDEQNEVTDSAYLGSESTYSECETFTDEDTGALVPPEMHEEVETDSGIEATLHDPDDASNRFSLNSELHAHSLVTVIGGEEEHFEDFGESNTSELLMQSGVEGGEGGVGLGDPSFLQTPEQVNGSLLLSPSAGKRLSSKKVARHLLQNSSMTLDTMSDLTRDILELADNDITDKVLLLERRVAELEKESESSGEQHARLRQENLQLVHRANAFEEQLKEQELLADEQLQLETRRHKDALNKLERERGLELENLQARLQQLDEENSELRSCVPCLRANIERLEEEKMKLEDETEAMSDRLTEETESRRKMGDKLSHERHQNHKEKENTQELIEDLRKQLEHLQLYKLEAEAKRGRTPGAGLQEYQTRTREAELEQEIKRLKQDNRSLKEQNDELNGQIINLSIQGAKNLMSASFSDSLAAEINSVSRSELMEAIHKQEEINYRLQDYIDKIIVAIMESNPSILEVK
ncbi:rab11 family-interacting protein 3 [Genypterus blacodes]|uniref:rab11 family-interacting protein 3 n=1 Tax=Genypterus blacodes TaxID=154954 RepID=UPI003F7651FF